jgi:hypothetical protein
MSSGPGPVKPWNTIGFALFGAALGVGVGIVHNFIHAFWSRTFQDDLLTHIVARMCLFTVAGAVILGAISAIRNRLMRARWSR